MFGFFLAHNVSKPVDPTLFWTLRQPWVKICEQRDFFLLYAYWVHLMAATLLLGGKATLPKLKRVATLHLTVFPRFWAQITPRSHTTSCCSQSSDISVLCQWLSTLRRVCALTTAHLARDCQTANQGPAWSQLRSERRSLPTTLKSTDACDRNVTLDKQSGFTFTNFYRRDTRFNTQWCVWAEKDPLGSVPGAWEEKKSHRKRYV